MFTATLNISAPSASIKYIGAISEMDLIQDYKFLPVSYGCKTCSVGLWDELRQRLFESRVLRAKNRRMKLKTQVY